MPSQQPLPPTPPLGPEGFAASTWQRWLEILRRRLSEAYGPDNQPPQTAAPGASAAAVGQLQKQLGQLQVEIAALPSSSRAAAELRKLAALLGQDAYFEDLLVTATLIVEGTSLLKGNVTLDTANLIVGGDISATGSMVSSGAFGCNGAPGQTATVLPANAVDPATSYALANAIKALLIANGQAT